jgi:protein-tyrosine phosphatase
LTQSPSILTSIFDPETRSAVHLLFVCTGNICRSPTAERLTAAYGCQYRIPDFHVSSAGTRAVIGHPIHPESAPILCNLGGDPSNFAARQLSAKIATSADLILTMTRAHRDSVLELAPHRLHRTFTLSEAAGLASKYDARTVAELAPLRSHLMADDAPDISDPIGKSAETFAAVGAQILDLVLPILRLCRTNSESIQPTGDYLRNGGSDGFHQ